jgi:hypothetical protein
MPLTFPDNYGKWEFSPCSGCCFNFGCYVDGVGAVQKKQHVDELSFSVSVAGSCPEAAGVSGTLTRASAVGCGTGDCADWPFLCSCVYSWQIDPDAVPECGPFISTVTLACDCPIEGFPGWGRPSQQGCTHVSRERCYWHLEIFVARSDRVRPQPPPCPLVEGEGPKHAVQQADCSWLCVDGDGDPVCNPDCPPCYACHLPPDGATCSGLGGCVECNPDCFHFGVLCKECWFAETGGQPNGPSCPTYCGGGTTITRRYHHFLTQCDDADQFRGCRPESCPPDPKNTSNIFLHFHCGDLSNLDYATVQCPGGEMLRLRKATKPELAEILVRDLSDEEVDELLARYEADDGTHRQPDSAGRADPGEPEAVQGRGE